MIFHRKKEIEMDTMERTEIDVVKQNINRREIVEGERKEKVRRKGEGVMTNTREERMIVNKEKEEGKGMEIKENIIGK